MLGVHAVEVFFVISGYLMTLVVNERYGCDAAGFGRFWSNRILRLYPSYWVVLSLTVVTIFLVGQDFTREFKSVIYFPGTIAGWLQNISMLYLSIDPLTVEPRMSDATWALTVELFYYFLISIGISRSKLITYVWFGASILYLIAITALKFDLRWYYNIIFAGSLPFSVGALCYHHRQEIFGLLERYQIRSWQLFCAALVIILGATYFPRIYLLEVDFPGSATLFHLLLPATILPAVIALFASIRDPWLPFGRRTDKVFGDLSYPVYISHWVVGIIVGYLLGIDKPAQSGSNWLLFTVTYIGTIGLSYGLIKLVDEPVEKLRDQIRTLSERRLTERN